MRNNYILTLFFLVSAICGYSQEGVNCATAIKEAEEMYRSGNYENAIQLLNTTLKECSLSKREKEDAYILLTQAYLEKENYADANHLITKVLTNDPNFKLKENLYQEDFYAYFKRTKVRPMLYAGVKLGLNSPIFSVQNVYNVYNPANNSAPYNSSTGYQYGAFVEYQFYDNISVMAEGSFSNMGYSRTINGSHGDLTDNGVSNYSLDYTEQMKSFETSLYVKKYFLHKQFKPFVYFGAYLSDLNRASASVELNYTQKDNVSGSPYPYSIGQDNVDVKNMRNQYRQGAVSGIGVSYKLKNFLVFADVAYRIDLGNNYTNSANRYNNEELLYTYHYVDNAVSLSRIDFSVSVSYIFMYSVKSK